MSKHKKLITNFKHVKTQDHVKMVGGYQQFWKSKSTLEHIDYLAVLLFNDRKFYTFIEEFNSFSVGQLFSNKIVRKRK